MAVIRSPFPIYLSAIEFILTPLTLIRSSSPSGRFYLSILLRIPTASTRITSPFSLLGRTAIGHRQSARFLNSYILRHSKNRRTHQRVQRFYFFDHVIPNAILA